MCLSLLYSNDQKLSNLSTYAIKKFGYLATVRNTEKLKIFDHIDCKRDPMTLKLKIVLIKIIKIMKGQIVRR